jgi:hypothetical protein
MSRHQPAPIRHSEWTARLLWESCRFHPRADVITDAVSQGADLERATAASIEHRIAPLLWRSLALADALDNLGQSQATLRSVFDTYRMEAVLLLPGAVALAVAPLTDAGLEPVVLKGPALAARYPEPGLRPMEDVDLLLPRAQHEQATNALRAAGWRIVRRPSRDAYDTMFVHRDVPSLALELHYGLEHPSQRVTRLDADALWQGRQPIDCLGTPAFGLPLAHEVVFLSMHAGKPHHGFFRLIWIADLAMVIGRATDEGATVEWHAVADIAHRGGCATLVAAALALARHAGVAAPPDTFPLPTSGWRGSAVAKLTDIEWPLSHLELPGYHLNYALADSPLRRLRILAVLLGSGHGIGQRARDALDGQRQRDTLNGDATESRH